jgi:hypothetical protein
MREFRSYGSVRGAVGNNRPYRERQSARETVRSALSSGHEYWGNASLHAHARQTS